MWLKLFENRSLNLVSGGLNNLFLSLSLGVGNLCSTLSPLSKIQDKRRAAALEARVNRANPTLPDPEPSSVEPTANVPKLGKNERFLVRYSYSPPSASK